MEKAGNRLLPLIVVFALVPLGPLAIDVYLPSIPQMMDVFGASDGDMRQTISIYILALGVSQLLAGPISDRFGRRFSAVLGTLVYAMGSILASLSPNMEVLYIARGMQGIGASFTMITAMAWVRDNYQGNDAGRLLSYIGGVTSAIPTIAPLIGSGLAMAWGWAGGFYMMAGLALLLMVLATVGFDSPKPVKVSVDIENTVALRCNIKDILSNKNFQVFALANLLSFGGLLTYVSVAPVVAMQQGGLSQVEFSMMFGLIGGSQILFSVIAPKVMNKLGRIDTVLTGTIMVAMAGIASGGFSLLAGAATSMALEPFQYCAGLASSIDGFLRMMGGAVLVAIASALNVDGTTALAIVYMMSLLATMVLMVRKRQIAVGKAQV
ncbi:MFS transporter [Vibrio harveyi]|uniref:MFS transporter n=1 Tax=Vibrio harveyi TaxID=669 RepID=UPI003BB49F37